ncbi:MAG: hypothetical protein A2Y33_00895 [Spirochaetes bacterium GWF1_51_8]|nr:MAG: hypothetical protein A2Y33_00895 [Spirochaetes bacterium GWF1_51_8]
MRAGLYNKIITLFFFSIISVFSGCTSIAKTIKDNPKSFNKYNEDGTLSAGIIKFAYYPDTTNDIKSVYLIGKFNEWKTDLPEYEFVLVEDGHFALEVEVPEGRYIYQYMFNGEWMMQDAHKDADGMEEIKNLIVPPPHEFYIECFGATSAIIEVK